MLGVQIKILLNAPRYLSLSRIIEAIAVLLPALEGPTISAFAPGRRGMISDGDCLTKYSGMPF